MNIHLPMRAGHPVSTALRLARLRRRFGLSGETASLVTLLAYEEGRD